MGSTQTKATEAADKASRGVRGSQHVRGARGAKGVAKGPQTDPRPVIRNREQQKGWGPGHRSVTSTTRNHSLLDYEPEEFVKTGPLPPSLSAFLHSFLLLSCS
jgi:hypothetical protein